MYNMGKYAKLSNFSKNIKRGTPMKIIPLSIDRLEDLVGLWNDELATQFPMRSELFKQNSFDDENVFLPGSLIAVNENNEVMGFIVCKRWQETLPVNMHPDFGWVQVLLVREKDRKQGIGSLLLERAESALRDDGANVIWLGSDPWHYFPGIPSEYEESAQWFEGKGYDRSVNEYDLIAHYDHAEEAIKPQLEGVEAVILKIEEKEPFLKFMNRVFPGRWEYEAIRYFDKGGTGREFVVLKKAGEIIGFCRINDDESPLIAQNVYWDPLFPETLGGIGPLGIDSSERKKGYGLAVVEAGIYFLRKRNINQIAIDWTGLVDFYGKMGYQVWKKYKKYSKSL